MKKYQVETIAYDGDVQVGYDSIGPLTYSAAYEVFIALGERYSLKRRDDTNAVGGPSDGRELRLSMCDKF